MTVKQNFAGISALVVALALSACGGGGGGGVGSTPTPVPTPTPTPTPAPSPTPTPAPSGTNASLTDLQHSETFQNNAARVGGKLNTTSVSASGVNAKTEALTLSYNAAAKSYTVKSAAGEATFLPSNKIASSGNTVEFKKISGSTSQDLYLTDAGVGTRYVRGGTYEKLVVGADATDAIDVMFNYGVVTPSGATPIAGKGLYWTSMQGTYVWDTAYRLYGSGYITADFSTGKLTSEGTSRAVRVFDGANQDGFAWSAGGTVSRNSSGFSGRFTIGGLDGAWNGSFYGPSGEEIGATFSAKSSDGSAAFAGFLLGKTEDTASYYTFIPNLTADIQFETPRTKVQFRYADGSYTYMPNSNQQIRVAQTDIVAPETDARYTVYRNVNGNDVQQLHLFNPGSGNPDIQLSYTTFGVWERTGGGGGIAGPRYAVLGVTGPALLDSPRTGTANYAGQVYGTSQSSLNGTQVIRDVRGEASFDMNFDTRILTGYMDSRGIDRDTGSTHEYGRFVFIDGAVAGRSFGANLSAQSQTIGNIEGYLYGPDGVELGASFNASVADRTVRDAFGYNPLMTIDGVVVGKIAGGAARP